MASLFKVLVTKNSSVNCQESVENKSKIHLINIKFNDINVENFEIDESHTGRQILKSICEELGISKPEEYSFLLVIERKKKEKDEAEKTSKLIWFVVPVVLAVAIILGIIFYHKEDLTTPLESVKVFSDSFVQLQASFPQQTPRFWRILRNRATAHLKNPNPKKPLVFMLTAGPSAHDVLDCVARKLAQSLDYKDNGIGKVFSGDYRQYSSLDEAKEKLDKTLDAMLQKGRTVLIFNVDRLPIQSPLLFYQYCDNENAPYKRAAIVFTVRLPAEPQPSLEPAKEEGLVAKYLRETWGKQDYRPDDIPPLVSRMTDTVVMVKQERNDTVEQHCEI